MDEPLSFVKKKILYVVNNLVLFTTYSNAVLHDEVFCGEDRHQVYYSCNKNGGYSIQFRVLGPGYAITSLPKIYIGLLLLSPAIIIPAQLLAADSLYLIEKCRTSLLQ
jgi:hypothetical protein